MATKDVAVFDGTGWVSISGGDGAPGDPGKSLELSPAPPSAATNVANIDDTTPGLATLTLNLNAGLSDDDKNVYDLQLAYLLVSGVRRVRLELESTFLERSLLKVIFRFQVIPVMRGLSVVISGFGMLTMTHG